MKKESTFDDKTPPKARQNKLVFSIDKVAPEEQDANRKRGVGVKNLNLVKVTRMPDSEMTSPQTNEDGTNHLHVTDSVDTLRQQLLSSINTSNNGEDLNAARIQQINISYNTTPVDVVPSSRNSSSSDSDESEEEEEEKAPKVVFKRCDRECMFYHEPHTKEEWKLKGNNFWR